MAQDEGPTDQGGDPEVPAEADQTAAKPPKKTPRPPTDLEYQKWWRAWRDMPEPRGHVRLARAVHANIHKVRHAVLVGWPELDYPAFKDRALLQEKQAQEVVTKIKQEAIAKAVDQTVAAEVQSWTDAAKRALGGLTEISKSIAQLSARVAEAATSASFVSYRRVPDTLTGPDGAVLRGPDGGPIIRRDAKGDPVMVLRPYVSGASVVQATRVLANASREHADLQKLLLASISPEDRPQVLSGPPALVLVMPENDDLKVPEGVG